MDPSLFRLFFKGLLFIFALSNPVLPASTPLFMAQAPPLCHNDSLSALLQFKRSLVVDMCDPADPSAFPRLKFWKLRRERSDCCSWDGVVCDKSTSHVIGLDLSSSCLYGSLNSNSSLFQLIYLRYLNLANNYFSLSQIPSVLGHLSQLMYLNLSNSVFSGQIPSSISQLSKLSLLDLSNNNGLIIDKLDLGSLVHNLTSLKYLHLDNVDISSTFPDIFTNLTSLRSLLVSYCGLHGHFPEKLFHLQNLRRLILSKNWNLQGELPKFNSSSPLEQIRIPHTNFHGGLPPSIGNLGSLQILDIFNCSFAGHIPPSLGNLTQLYFLDLTQNIFESHDPSLLSWLGKQTKLTLLGLNTISLNSEIPAYLSNLTQLNVLGLSSCQLQGPLPNWLANLTRLNRLFLDFNNLQGAIPQQSFELKDLEFLNLAGNNFSGMVEFDKFLKLKKLTQIFLYENNLSLLYKANANVSVPKFLALDLGSCNLQQFPDFLRDQDKLYWLGLSNNNIHGQVPIWLWNTTKNTLGFVDLSRNFLTGFEQYPVGFPWTQAQVVYLDENTFEGSLPLPPPSVKVFSMSGNNLTGGISSRFCTLNSLYVLDLSSNHLSGELPQCLGNFSTSLHVLYLDNNNFNGKIPQTYPEKCSLSTVGLCHNKLEGELLRSLANCSRLETLILGNNRINDVFPSWLGVLQELQVLILRSNLFNGELEGHEVKFGFPKLRMVDLSQNNFSGLLPIGFFLSRNAMKVAEFRTTTYLEANVTESIGEEGSVQVTVYPRMTLTNKGQETEYGRILEHFIAIDFSGNKFGGLVPECIGELKGLRLLNLSNNILTGPIPSSFADLSNIEALDVSQNNLSGEIPEELVRLTFLSFLNMSCNHLTGSIPHGGQFDTFQNDSFSGNPGLCGGPLSKKCVNSPTPPNSEEDDESKGSPFEFGWLPVAIGYACGFVFGVGIGHIVYTKKRVWIVKIFGEKRKMRRVVRGIGSR